MLSSIQTDPLMSPDKHALQQTRPGPARHDITNTSLSHCPKRSYLRIFPFSTEKKSNPSALCSISLARENDPKLR